MRIIIDAMGGDNAPSDIVKGAVEAVEEYGVEMTLVGKDDEVRDCLLKEGITQSDERFTIVNATEVVEMEDDPSTVLRSKKDSSMSVALRMLRDGQADACISAGSTGALLSGATLVVKRVRGIRRAALAPVIPNGANGTLLIDCGANVECTPEYLLQFAYMGSFYAKRIMGCASPKVGLLNVGTEDTKGGELQKSSFALLKKAAEEGNINFIGNVEARDVFTDVADVVVCDGFSGNILLKASEGMARFISSNLKEIMLANKRSKLGALILRRGVEELKKTIDPSEVGGTALLGISKPVIKAHGSSDARAIKNAVRQAIISVNADVANEIKENIDLMTLSRED